jgi:triosephosphate isomerase
MQGGSCRAVTGRPRYFGTNLKMHQTAGETTRFVAELALQPAGGVQRFVIPPFTSLAAAIDLAHAADIWIGAQNLHAAPDGEYTGEISGRMLRALNVDLALVGHAERRRMFGEDDAIVRGKVEAALANDLRVLLCVGESADERRCGAAVETVLRQVRLALNGVADRSRVMVAYEPVWAIGARAQPAEPRDVGTVTAALGEWLEATPLLYGGSVNAATAAGYALLPGIDGLFVGRAAWTPDGFTRVLAAAAL